MRASLTAVSNVRDSVRELSLRDFSFFANTVLAAQLAEDVCAAAQDAVVDREDCTVRTGRPRALALALSAWLTTQGVSVLTTVVLPRHEVLEWLELTERTKCGDSVVLDLVQHGVNLRWM